MFLLLGRIFSTVGDKAYYLDPGSGSFLIQLLIAGLAGLSIALASQWRKIKKFLNRKKGIDNSENEDEENEE